MKEINEKTKKALIIAVILAAIGFIYIYFFKYEKLEKAFEKLGDAVEKLKSYFKKEKTEEAE